MLLFALTPRRLTQAPYKMPSNLGAWTQAFYKMPDATHLFL